MPIRIAKMSTTVLEAFRYQVLCGRVEVVCSVRQGWMYLVWHWARILCRPSPRVWSHKMHDTHVLEVGVAGCIRCGSGGSGW